MVRKYFSYVKIKMLNSCVRDNLVILMILLLGFSIRYYFQEYSSFPTTDGSLYCEIASNIANEGKLYSRSIWYPETSTGYPIAKYGLTRHPIFPLILAISFKIFESTYYIAKITVVLFGTLSIYIVYLITKKLFNNKISCYLSAIIYSIHPLHILRSSHVAGPDIISSFFILIYLYFLYIYMKGTNKNIKIQILLGFLLSLIFYSYRSDFVIISIITFFNLIFIIYKKQKTIDVMNNIIENIYIPITLFLLLIPWIMYNLQFTSNFLFIIGEQPVKVPGSFFLGGLSSFWITSIYNNTITISLFIIIIYFISLIFVLKSMFVSLSKKNYYLFMILSIPLLNSIFYSIFLYPDMKMNSRFLTSSLMSFTIASGYIFDVLENNVDMKIFFTIGSKLIKKIKLSREYVNIISIILLLILLAPILSQYSLISNYLEYKDERFEHIKIQGAWILDNTNSQDLIATPYGREMSWLTQRKTIVIPTGMWGSNISINTINEFYDFSRHYNISYLIVDSFSIGRINLINKYQLLNREYPEGLEIIHSDNSFVVYDLTNIYENSFIILETEYYDQLDNTSYKRYESSKWDWDNDSSNGMYVVFNSSGYAKYLFDIKEKRNYDITINMAKTHINGINKVNIYLDQNLIGIQEFKRESKWEWMEYDVGSYEINQGRHELLLEIKNFDDNKILFFIDYVLLS